MTIRLLGLGNDLLADDAFGLEVLREIAPALPPCVQTTTSIAGGLGLLDELVGADELIVVDAITTGDHAPGTVQRFEASQAVPAPGQSAHYVGLFEALQLGAHLGLHMPSAVVVIAVEAGDCLTIGGPMSAQMRAALPVVERMIHEQVARWQH